MNAVRGRRGCNDSSGPRHVESAKAPLLESRASNRPTSCPPKQVSIQAEPISDAKVEIRRSSPLPDELLCSIPGRDEEHPQSPAEQHPRDSVKSSEGTTQAESKTLEKPVIDSRDIDPPTSQNPSCVTPDSHSLLKEDTCSKNSRKDPITAATSIKAETPREGLSTLEAIQKDPNICSTLRPELGPTALEMFNTVLGIDAKKRLVTRSPTCLANTQIEVKGAFLQCQIKIPQANVGRIEQLFTILDSPQLIDEPKDRMQEYEELTQLGMCSKWHQKTSSTILRRWNRDKDLPRNSATIQVTKTAVKGQSKVLTFDFDSNQIRIEEPLKQYLSEFIPYREGDGMKYSVIDWILETATKPLNQKERYPGYLYAYRHPGSFGFHKIGYTTITVPYRIKKWIEQCKHEAIIAYQSPIKLPFVHRIEKLVHAELKDYRHHEPVCYGCGRGHIEWFNANVEHFQRVMEKWTAFAMTVPYEEKNGQWTMKKSHDEELLWQCQDLQLPRVMPVQQKKLPKPPAPGKPPVRRSARIAARSVNAVEDGTPGRELLFKSEMFVTQAEVKHEITSEAQTKQKVVTGLEVKQEVISAVEVKLEAESGVQVKVEVVSEVTVKQEAITEVLA